VHPVVFFDALRVKIRQQAVVRKAILSLDLPDGRGTSRLWIERTETSDSDESLRDLSPRLPGHPIAAGRPQTLGDALATIFSRRRSRPVSSI
jgi:hypothetical protein